MTTELECDVLIIGSGAGGGTVAERLSPLVEDGARIIVAEAGAHYTRDNFNMREPDMLGLFMDRGAVPSTSFEIAVAAGACVGGSTSIYTGVTFRAPQGLIGDWARSYGLDELDEADVQARFPRIEEEIHAHFPDRSMENRNNRLFREGCEQLGWEAKAFRLNIHDCKECGFCNLGCPYDSKRGTLVEQLPRAMARGVELIPNCRITKLGDGRAEGIIQQAPEKTRASEYPVGQVRFRAKVIVLAAGTLRSSPLLLASGLDDLSPACGKYVTLHPALTSFGRMDEEVMGFDGFPKLYFMDRFSEEHHYYLETAFYFPFVTAKSLPGFGAGLKQFMRDYRKLTCMLTLVHDEPEESNAMRLVQGKPVLDYRLSKTSRAALLHALRSAGRIAFESGANAYVSPISDRLLIEREADLSSAITPEVFQSGRVVVSSAHPMGGCRMGGDPATSVTNAWGEVHGHPDIVVADASLFPASSKVNPYLTIMALAERAAERITHRLQR